MTGGSRNARLRSATITNQFWEKESSFWNSSLRITAYGQDP